MNAETAEFQIPESAQPSQPERVEDYTRNPQNTAESAPEAQEIPQLTSKMLRIGGYLEEYRERKLANSRENTAFAGLRRIFSQQKDRNDLIREEVRATSGMFTGETSNRRYDFFYYGIVPDGSHEWIFHEWEKHGKEWNSLTTRYLIQPHTVYRSQEGQRYMETPRKETKRLWEATDKYYNKVRETVYS